MGAYSSSTAYVANDVVSSGGGSYICILASTGNAVSNSTYWNLMSQAGTDLTGTLTTQGDVVFRDGTGLQRLAPGTSGQYLQTQGSGSNVVWADVAAGGGYTSQQIFLTPQTTNAQTTHTWTKPADISKIRVYITGAGGGGGYYWGGGGGGGGTAIKDIDVTSITSVTVTLGAGGQLVSSNPATDGGTSSFGSHCSATGGEGGGPHGHSNDAFPGEGGLGSGGDLNLPGGGGTHGANGGWGDAGGTGGNSFWAGGIRGEHSSSHQKNYDTASYYQTVRNYGQGDPGYLNSGSVSPTKAAGGVCVVYEYK